MCASVDMKCNGPRQRTAEAGSREAGVHGSQDPSTLIFSELPGLKKRGKNGPGFVAQKMGSRTRFWSRSPLSGPVFRAHFPEKNQVPRSVPVTEQQQVAGATVTRARRGRVIAKQAMRPGLMIAEGP